MIDCRKSGDLPLVWYMAQGYPLRGGIEAHILHYATEMRSHGFSTKVVVPNPLPRQKHLFMELLDKQDIPLESVADTMRPWSLVLFCCLVIPWTVRQIVKGRKWTWRNLLAYLRYEMTPFALRTRVKRERPDIIHVFGRLADNLWTCLPAERSIFHHMTDGKVDGSWTVPELDHFRDFAARAARYCVPGNGVAANIRREIGVTRPMDIVYTMVPDEADSMDLDFPPDKSDVPLRFGILCRMTDEKGIMYLISALERFGEKHTEVSFIFAGKGYMEPVIEKFIVCSKLPNVRQMKDFASTLEVMRQLDVFVHPSVTDAMPMAIAEALMCGKPCIGTKVGGIPDLVRDGIDGFIIEPHNADEILDRMNRFADMNTGTFKMFRRNARSRYEDVCRPACVGAVVAEYYREILKDG